MTEAASSRPRASDRATVERTVRDLILGVVEQRGRRGHRAGTSHRLPDLLLGTALPIVIVVYMLKFSKSYPDRITQGEAGAPAVS